MLNFVWFFFFMLVFCIDVSLCAVRELEHKCLQTLVGESKGERLLGNRGRSWERSIYMVKGKDKGYPRSCHKGPDCD